MKSFAKTRQKLAYPRILLRELVVTDFKLRYQGSALGYAWSLLRPLLLFLILYIVFVKFFNLGKGIEHYPVYLLLGIVIWNFFAEMTTQSLTSIVSRGEIIRKIPMPRWVIVISSSISALINLILNMLVVGIFIVVNHVDIHHNILWLPLILFEVYVFALGLSLLLSSLFVKYRDISYIWEVILQAGFYLTPILYPLSHITSLEFQKLIMLNPMAQAIQDARYSTVTHQSSTIYHLFNNSVYKAIPFVIVGVIFVTGVSYFRRRAAYFAEDI